MKQIVLFLSMLFGVVLLATAQESFTEAYKRFRPYHYQTPQAWNRIRREVVNPQEVVWSLMERDTRYMYLTGTWKELIPVPTAENTYFFKGEDDLGEMYKFIMTPNAHGYVVYPYGVEQKFQFSKNETTGKNIIRSGFMNTVVSDIPEETEELLDLVIYNDTTDQKSTEEILYNQEEALKWQLSSENRNLCNIRNFYCYFDNRADSLRHKVKYTTQATKDFDNEVADLTAALDTADLSYVIVPYWMTDLYLSVPEPVTSGIARFGYPAYIINPVNGGIDLNNGWNTPNVMDFGPFANIKYDLVAYCGDAISLNTFLSNTEACRQFIFNIFNVEKGIINRRTGHKPSGVHLYFPEFDFKKKRAMKQLVKSVSLVIDSLTINSEKIYSDLDLVLTFSKEAKVKEFDYLSGLQDFVDAIQFADFDSNGLDSQLIISDGSVDTSSVWAKIVNPFYLFRVPYKTIKPGINDGDLMAVADSDYAAGAWGIYLIITIILFVVLISILVLRYFSPLINHYMEVHQTAMVLLMITLVMEIGVFFFFMIEALSPQYILFDMFEGGAMHLFLMAVPILPIAIYLAVKYLAADRDLP